MEVKFYDTVEDKLLKFAVIVAKSNGKWVLCKHKERDTYECPGGHREAGENIDDTAKRELYEETGAIDYTQKLAPKINIKNCNETQLNENLCLLSHRSG